MKCTVVRNWLFRSIDGELSDSEKAELNAHLAQCAACSREYKLLELPQRVARETPPPAPSPFFYRQLRMRIEGETQRAAGWQLFFGLARQMIPTLAGITLALLSVFAYFQLRVPETDLYKAYDRVFVSEDQSHRTLVAENGDISDESVLRAIAER